MKETLRKYLNRYVAFNNKEFELFYQHLQQKVFSKKSYLLKEGETCRYQYFITSGLVRSFYIDNKGIEKITQFAIENWWVTHLESFKNENPSTVNIQALEETTVLFINKQDLDALFLKIPKLDRFFRLITENMLIATQRRHEFYMNRSSKERYEFLVNSLPDFAQRVPQYMIASYLEITPEYLSELRKQK